MNDPLFESKEEKNNFSTIQVTGGASTPQVMTKKKKEKINPFLTVYGSSEIKKTPLIGNF